MLQSPRVLFVDDEENIRKALYRMFRKEAWEVAFAASGEEALALLDAGPPFDLVVTDQRMPGMTGVELLRAMRQRHPKVVRMILSAYSDAATVLDAINEGSVYKFLTKSCSDQVLKESVREVLDAIGLAKENRRLTRQLEDQTSEIEAVDWLAEALRTTEVASPAEDLVAAFEAAPVGLVVADAENTAVHANAAALRLLGADREGLLGAPWPGEWLRRQVDFTVREAPIAPSLSGGSRVFALWRQADD